MDDRRTMSLARTRKLSVVDRVLRLRDLAVLRLGRQRLLAE